MGRLLDTLGEFEHVRNVRSLRILVPKTRLSGRIFNYVGCRFFEVGFPRIEITCIQFVF